MQDEYATNPKKIYTFEVSSQSTICGQVGSWCSKNRHTLLFMSDLQQFSLPLHDMALCFVNQNKSLYRKQNIKQNSKSDINNAHV